MHSLRPTRSVLQVIPERRSPAKFQIAGTPKQPPLPHQVDPGGSFLFKVLHLSVVVGNDKTIRCSDPKKNLCIPQHYRVNASVLAHAPSRHSKLNLLSDSAIIDHPIANPSKLPFQDFFQILPCITFFTLCNIFGCSPSHYLTTPFSSIWSNIYDIVRIFY